MNTLRGSALVRLCAPFDYGSKTGMVGKKCPRSQVLPKSCPRPVHQKLYFFRGPPATLVNMLGSFERQFLTIKALVCKTQGSSA